MVTLTTETLNSDVIDDSDSTNKFVTAEEKGQIGNECFFPIWAEENSTLGNNTYEWAFGNGANTANDEGVMLYVPSGWSCTVVAMGAQIGTAASSATIELVVNGVLQGGDANVVLVEAANGLQELETPLSVSSGDRINFRTTSAASTQAACTVIAWFRMVKD